MPLLSADLFGDLVAVEPQGGLEAAFGKEGQEAVDEPLQLTDGAPQDEGCGWEWVCVCGRGGSDERNEKGER